MLAALPLAACGYTPAYAPGGKVADLFGRVETEAPSNDSEFELVARIEERLGRPTAAAYALDYDIATRQFDLAVTRVNAITRYNVEGEATFRITDKATGKALSEGKLNTFTSYAASGTTVATDAAKTDAYRRLMRLLADQIVTRIAADLSAP